MLSNSASLALQYNSEHFPTYLKMKQNYGLQTWHKIDKTI